MKKSIKALIILNALVLAESALKVYANNNFACYVGGSCGSDIFVSQVSIEKTEEQ